jgi:membrane peptidoglycan carboxypeptidase
VVLEVRANDGTVLYTHGADLVKKPVVNAGSVWMLHSIMSDCQARFIIWTCGSSNDDLALDFFLDGKKIPGGIKTGTQQGFLNLDDTLETWMNGYTRYGAFSLWVGNADNSLVHDGRRYGFAAANTTVRLFKNWVSAYHADLKAKGVFDTPAGFDELKPSNVVFKPYLTATTERGAGGGCHQMLPGWQRTDVKYLGDCDGKGYVPLPELGRADAIKLAAQRGIPIAPGQGISVVAGATAPPESTETVVSPSTPVQSTPTPKPGSPTPKPASPTPTPKASPQPSPTAPPGATTTPAPGGAPVS